MRLYELKTCDVVVLRDGQAGIVLRPLRSIVFRVGHNTFGEYNEDLTSGRGYRPHDIIAVWRPTSPYQCQFSPGAYTCGTLIYCREEDAL